MFEFLATLFIYSPDDTDDPEDFAPEGEPSVGVAEQRVRREVVIHVAVEPGEGREQT